MREKEVGKLGQETPKPRKGVPLGEEENDNDNIPAALTVSARQFASS